MLSDERKRDIYDRYGEEGLENGAGEVRVADYGPARAPSFPKGRMTTCTLPQHTSQSATAASKPLRRGGPGEEALARCLTCRPVYVGSSARRRQWNTPEQYTLAEPVRSVHDRVFRKP